MVSIVLLLMSGSTQPALAQAGVAPTGTAQQSNPTAPVTQPPTGSDQNSLPPTPAPKLTEPLYLRDTGKDYTRQHPFFPNPLKLYTPTEVPMPRLGNTPRLDSLLRDGKIYLSLSDAVLLALENNFDVAIARINLDIADTDILRAKAGSSLRGVSTGLVTTTLGGSGSTVTGGGGPGGTSSGSGGGGTGANGLVLSTNGNGPAPENLDPYLTGTTEFERTTSQQTSAFAPGATSNTFTSNYGYQQGFLTGTQLSVTFNNSRQTTNNPFSSYSPLLNTTLRAQLTQHLLQGFGPGINGRFIVQAKNDRRIADSTFR